MAFIVQEFKLKDGDQVGDILDESFAESVISGETIARMRMAHHHHNGTGVSAVRVVDTNGKEIFRWTWWDQQREHQANAAEDLRRKAEAARNPNG